MNDNTIENFKEHFESHIFWIVSIVKVRPHSIISDYDERKKFNDDGVIVDVLWFNHLSKIPFETLIKTLIESFESAIIRIKSTRSEYEIIYTNLCKQLYLYVYTLAKITGIDCMSMISLEIEIDQCIQHAQNYFPLLQNSMILCLHTPTPIGQVIIIEGQRLSKYEFPDEAKKALAQLYPELRKPTIKHKQKKCGASKITPSRQRAIDRMKLNMASLNTSSIM